MRARCLVLVLTLLLSLVSCTDDEVDAFYISCDQEARALFFRSGTLVEVVAGSDVLPRIEGTLEDLFGIQAASGDTIPVAAYRQRLGYYEDLAWVMGLDDPYVAYAEDRRNLSAFIDTVDALTPVFDERLFAKSLEGMRRHYTYDLAEVLEHVSQDALESFMQLWLTSALN